MTCSSAKEGRKENKQRNHVMKKGISLLQKKTVALAGKPCYHHTISLLVSFSALFSVGVYICTCDHGLRTHNEGINQKYLKNWADVADKICFGRT